MNDKLVSKMSDCEENLIEFLCLRCKRSFECNVGKIDFEKYLVRPSFENAVICDKCGTRYESSMENFSDHFELTEVGQTQLTEIHIGGPSCFYFGFGSDEEDDFFEDDEIELRVPITKEKKVGRNEPCPCGSGKKFKKCCDKPE
jgi:hypothetical protein